MDQLINLKLTDQEAVIVIQALAAMLARDPNGLEPVSDLLGKVRSAIRKRNEDAAKAEKALKAKKRAQEEDAESED